uniref:Uncharacterized protein n=1 Tax=Rhizophora mucronata TaxID=61149 RepID=A0A2P2P3X8_RHIMU
MIRMNLVKAFLCRLPWNQFRNLLPETGSGLRQKISPLQSQFLLPCPSLSIT